MSFTPRASVIAFITRAGAPIGARLAATLHASGLCVQGVSRVSSLKSGTSAAEGWRVAEMIGEQLPVLS